MFSSPFYLNDTIQDELDNYSYHTTFETGQNEFGYANLNFLVQQSNAQAIINEDCTLSQLNMDNLTPKKWYNHQQQFLKHNMNSLHNKQSNFISSTITQASLNQNEEATGRMNARRLLPFTSLADRNTQSVSATEMNNQLSRKRNFNNLTIIRPNYLPAQNKVARTVSYIRKE